MRKLYIVIILIVLIGFGVVAYFFVKGSGRGDVSQGELTDRGREFLEKQRSEGNRDFAGVRTDSDNTQDIPRESIVEAGNCFTINIPFPITNQKTLDECFEQIQIGSPKGMINVYTKDVSYSSLDEDSGVRMRRLDPEKYEEESLIVNDYAFLIFKKKDGGYEKTALYLSGGELFALNLLSNSSDRGLDDKFEAMLESVEMK